MADSVSTATVTALSNAISKLLSEAIVNATQENENEPQQKNHVYRYPETPVTREIDWVRKPIIIGIYGLPGSGKTTLLKSLKSTFDPTKIKCYEGSEVITNLVPGGLDNFKKMSTDEKTMWRKRTIKWIEWRSVYTQTHAVVVGHFMFWDEGTGKPSSCLTSADWSAYTHIIYLKIDPKIVAERTKMDNQFGKRARTEPSVLHLQKWQDEETSQLRTLCYKHKVLFAQTNSGSVEHVEELIAGFEMYDTKFCTFTTQLAFSCLFDSNIETVLVLDADRTLTSQDTGKMFFDEDRKVDLQSGKDPLKQLFSSHLGYTYEAFRQANLLYQESHDMSYRVVEKVEIHPEFKTLLGQVKEHKHVGVVVLTCGLDHIWERVLSREGFKEVKVFGNLRPFGGIVVTPAMKGQLVGLLQSQKKRVIAIGDSPLDMDMLIAADEAIIAVGDPETRSKTMDDALSVAINDGELIGAYQVLLPESSTPRLDTIKLPLIRFTDDEFQKIVFDRHNRTPDPPPHDGPDIVDAGDKAAAKLLMTSMRDANNSGPTLRSAHFETGAYLANEYLGGVIGLEEYDINHVQGGLTKGFRLKHEAKTTIVALMRGGESMAFGVNDVFPLAMFVHARDAEDLKSHHLEGQEAVILVDSVINKGTTVVKFVEHVLKLRPKIRIVVFTGVVQNECIEKGGIVYELAAKTDLLTIITLRISKNKFTGTGTTDTGNRLFNTTALP